MIPKGVFKESPLTVYLYKQLYITTKLLKCAQRTGLQHYTQTLNIARACSRLIEIFRSKCRFPPTQLLLVYRHKLQFSKTPEENNSLVLNRMI